MPQGKLKVKAKVPNSVKRKNSKPVSSQRKNKPIAPKKGKHEEAEKLKKIITKNLNKNIETELRSIAVEGSKVTASKRKEITAEANRMPPKKKVTQH